ncbi:DUF72 domain-containing protein [Pedobacter gandavensis]|uniref:DUF72 domain-containing protein n=1 Tax=Pedobacter gandavensis TaxID=2679963 RepID=A0ABR6EW43_9SPHI|nr:DUF72 domain-containing protein [Pedobacter gandavensis]MBB2149009.1 DUF72 domain-containing protein [Pedobacter gandavensis]
MDFGKVSNDELKMIDFSLPADGEQTSKTLSVKKNGAVPEFYVGCAKWGRKEWVGMIYPAKTKEANFLDEYVKHFNSIELNAVFYSLPKPEQIRKWKEKAALNARNGFVFCPKFSQTITHMKRLKGAEEATDIFLAGISEFGEYLGPCFLQMGDNFGPKNREILAHYLEYLPTDLSVFVELRNGEWFNIESNRKTLFEMLARLNKGAAITDASGRRDVIHMELTIPEVFIRFVGNGSEFKASDEARIDEWVKRLKIWLDQGLEKIYFFLHQHDEMDTPILANYTIKAFNKHLGSQLPEIDFLDGKK